MNMNLEDHLGDLLRKARKVAGVSVAAAAKTAGLSASELENLENCGEIAQPVNLRALAVQVGLDPAKLEVIAAGWRPRPQALERWRHLCQIATTEDGNTVNSFLVWDESTRDAALFDTGWKAGPVLEVIAEHRLQLRFILMTHAHHDHVAALPEFRQQFPEVKTAIGSEQALAALDGNGPSCGRFRLFVRPAPGHADEGCVYLVQNWPDQAPPVAVVGDTLFAGSMARGFVSAQTLRQKIREQILSLPPETLLCPGHGPVTTVAEEIDHNPFF